MIVKGIKHLVESQLLVLERVSCPTLWYYYVGIAMALTVSCGYDRSVFKAPRDSHKITLKKMKFRGNEKTFFFLKYNLP